MIKKIMPVLLSLGLASGIGSYPVSARTTASKENQSAQLKGITSDNIGTFASRALDPYGSKYGTLVDSGTYGTRWYVYDNRGIMTLVIEAGDLVLKGNISSSPWRSYGINQIVVEPVYGESMLYLPSNSSYLFAHLLLLKTIDTSHMDTSNVTDMSYMFSQDDALQSLDVSKFDTSKVTNMHCLFEYCLSVPELDISNFNTSNVTDMNYMFADCKALTTIDFPVTFDTSKVTRMSSMFSGCKSITHMDLSNFDTSNVTDMSTMFLRCRSIKKLDLSNFDTRNVTSMSSMFSDCDNLETLNISSFNTEKVDWMSGLFGNCNSLSSINLGPYYFASSSTRKEYNFPGQQDIWIQASNPANQKTWAQMADTWTSKDAGWWNKGVTLTFQSGEGASQIQPAAAIPGTVIDLSKYVPVKTGYTFGGWYSDQNLTTPVTKITLTGNTTVYAKWNIQEYTLTFDTNGGSAVPSITRGSGSKIDLSSVSTAKPGYTFAGWYSDQNLTKPVTEVTFSSNITVYAKWVPLKLSLTFETNGGSSILPVTQDFGTRVDLSKFTPVKNGYVFAGWYSDKDLTKPVDEILLTGDTTIYAKWSVQAFTLSFETNGGAGVSPVTMGSGAAVDLSTITTTKAGYVFAGWYSDKDLTKPVDEIILTENTMVYAKWSVQAFTLSFETNGGVSVSPVTMGNGATIDLSTITTAKAGYDFAGWYSDKDLTKPVSEVKLTGNITVYAKWTLIPVTDNPSTDDPGTTPKPEVTAGWRQNANGTWSWVESDGTILKESWKYNRNTWYYLNSDGFMVTGWATLPDGDQYSTYYFDRSGAMKTNWLNLNGTWYYFGSDGAMKTGWVKQNDIWYYLNANGEMLTGWLHLNGIWYYLDHSGAMVKGWKYLQWDGVPSWYYFWENGEMASNTYIGIYYLNSSGVCTNPDA